ncbi:cupin domain-containing protein [Fulvivirgaceae bacterium BMA10]|uniref:Cupin domain-containing protein n=1 Tax=Splendidivirga corallicola TaxID=3051826 RepID=A0ABT8KWB5_9BACT|nr:cupin domain-containing protein [Fulvivirgaceae bacterium BMA10]
MINDADYWIQALDLQEHPEGGHFKEVYRSNELINEEDLPERFKGKRCFSTSVYYLLNGNEFSSFHKIKSDELWHFYAGTALTLYVIDSGGQLQKIKLGKDLANSESFQTTVQAGNWFAARVNDPESYALVGCTVAPGFDFDDFELASRKNLIATYPQHKNIIESLTK